MWSGWNPRRVRHGRCPVGRRGPGRPRPGLTQGKRSSIFLTPILSEPRVGPGVVQGLIVSTRSLLPCPSVSSRGEGLRKTETGGLQTHLLSWHDSTRPPVPVENRDFDPSCTWFQPSETRGRGGGPGMNSNFRTLEHPSRYFRTRDRSPTMTGRRDPLHRGRS